MARITPINMAATKIVDMSFVFVIIKQIVSVYFTYNFLRRKTTMETNNSGAETANNQYHFGWDAIPCFNAMALNKTDNNSITPLAGILC